MAFFESFTLPQFVYWKLVVISRIWTVIENPDEPTQVWFGGIGGGCECGGCVRRSCSSPSPCPPPLPPPFVFALFLVSAQHELIVPMADMFNFKADPNQKVGSSF